MHAEDAGGGIQKEAHTFLGVTFTVSQQMELQPTAQH